MPYERLVPPAGAAVSLDEAKRQLRLTDSASDAELPGLMAAAEGLVEAQTGLALIAQTVRVPLTLSQFTAADGGVPTARLPVGPKPTLVAARFVGADAPALLRLEPGGRVALLSAVPLAARGVELDLVVGFGPPSHVPAALRQAVLVALGHLFIARDDAQGARAAIAPLLAGFVPMRL
jgi:uncharacterized phiE125 gp8 family phage protein